MTVAHPFAPVFDADSRLLILGSFPSVRSREQGFYYGHPQNRFWRMLALVYGEETPETIDEKTRLLLKHGLALWDAAASCDILGSRDDSIRAAAPTDLSVILSQARIARVLCNGQTAGALYRRLQAPRTGLPALVLPSTSPANAQWPLDRLCAVWKKALLDT